jgi:hypothetical protein
VHSMNMLVLSLWSKLVLLHFLWNTFLDSFDCILQTQDSASLMCFLFPMYSNSEFVFPLVCIPSTVESPSILKLCTSKEHCLPASPSEFLQQGDQCKENGNNFWASPVTEIWWCCNSSQVMQGKTSWIMYLSSTKNKLQFCFLRETMHTFDPVICRFTVVYGLCTPWMMEMRCTFVQVEKSSSYISLNIWDLSQLICGVQVIISVRMRYQICWQVSNHHIQQCSQQKWLLCSTGTSQMFKLQVCFWPQWSMSGIIFSAMATFHASPLLMHREHVQCHQIIPLVWYMLCILSPVTVIQTARDLSPSKTEILDRE